MGEYGKLGIVVIGRNEGERFRRCLSSMLECHRVVYVDSGSTDDSVAHARAIGADVVQLDASLPFTAARARNEGFARLLDHWPSTAFVQFVDGDCEFEDGWLRQSLSFLETHTNVAAVCGRRRERFPNATLYNRLCDEEWNTPVGLSLACGGDVMMRASAFQEVAAYDPTLIAGEEPELCARLRSHGWVIWRLGIPMTVHDAAMFRFNQWWLRALRSGYGYAQVFHRTALSPVTTLYARELCRAIFWCVGVPLLAIILALLFGPTGLLAAPLIWIAQFFRLSLAHGPAKGALLLIGKLAELIGATRYAWTAMINKPRGAIFYK
ncbi:glycosyltransferase [Altererythrobacter salegens]|uniref:Glycosyltransferase n=1 Tax=Croceibacterium salegens TaxID=1737568 RepID=A0A6I4T0C0_9SPHN|nr:glycosyltransferase family A protein [Croceibacterium salegens]MXO60717.1 glycosyltransferase [Croceibacterium salegens]